MPPGWIGYLVGAWFVVISVMRLLVIAVATPGFDGRLYRTATRRLAERRRPVVGLQRRDPLRRPSADPARDAAVRPRAGGRRRRAHHRARVRRDGVGDPPSRAAAVVARLPAPHRRAVQRQPARPGAAAAGGGGGADRRPGRRSTREWSRWSSATGGRWRSSAAVLVVTIPFLPWGTYIAEWSSVTASLADQSDGGMSALGDPGAHPGRRHRPARHGPAAGCVVDRAGVVAEHAVVLRLARDARRDLHLRRRRRHPGAMVVDARGCAGGGRGGHPPPRVRLGSRQVAAATINGTRCYPRPDDHPDPRRGACLSGADREPPIATAGRRPRRRPVCEPSERPFADIPRATWDGLAARNPWATPFSGWAFQRAWWDAYGANAHEETLVVVRSDAPADGRATPVAIVPLMHRHEVEPTDALTHTTMRHGARSPT